ncbi:DUF3987 domain-containing protein [Streptomyces sp. NPDC006355]|uniref:DUF3987 domain-containing protein n=1 Tax=Streptomyces sp. NPDC006355 TaxID=3156758 RepID=UPI0033A69007
MSLEAFEGMRYGPIGDAVAAAEPHTEADPVGIYAAMLALWSCAVNGYVCMDNGRPVVVWTVLAGGSAIGRKGTALRVARKTMEGAIGSFLSARTEGGVSSGPSLTQLLYEKQEETMGTEGGTDTRLVVVDQEWSENLKRQNRCPTFASKLRQCWDGETIRHTTTKVSMTVEQPRLGFHTHITPGEWSEYVKPRDAKGGSFNRLLPVLVEGSKVLPYGHKELYPDVPELAEAYNWARITPRRMSLSKDAGKRFDELRVMFLAKLAEMPDHLRCYIERTPEQIIRVAAVLTVTERRTTVSREAVNAAWAFVQYSMRSVEKLVREEPLGKTKGAKSLPELIREILDQYEGEATSSIMLRRLGMRATSASLRAAVASMDDVEMFKGQSASGRGRPPEILRRIQPETASEPEPAQPELSLTLTQDPPEKRELALAGEGWL